ncbi:hypothetical protein [Lentzea sp. NPDC051838]|uniref:hypothetical protein n=1 Tax=Lentzea sp. NPDC051838 TaxID=3154849 RepID=UPI00343CDA02
MHRLRFRRAWGRALATIALTAAAAAVLPTSPASAAASPLPNDVTFASTPIIDPTGLFMVSRGLDGTVLFSTGNPATAGYSDFFSIGGPIIGDPTAVVESQGAQVYARSTTNKVITSSVISYSFPTPFQEIGGLDISSEVTAVKIPDSPARARMTRIFARDAETGGLYTNLIVNETPQGWNPLLLYTTSEVTAALIPQTSLDFQMRLVVRGFDNRLYSTVLNNTTGLHNGWEGLGSMTAGGNPVLTNDGFTFEYRGDEVFVRGTNGALWTWNFNAPGWVSFGGNFQGDPGVSLPKGGGLHVYTRGVNQRIFLMRRPPGGVFGGFLNLGGRATSNIAAAGGAGSNRRPIADQFITRSLENRMHSRILPDVNRGFGGFFYFGGPLHG